jgi:hypothetical protein
MLLQEQNMLNASDREVQLLYSNFNSIQAKAIVELSKQMIYITPYSNRFGEMRGEMSIGNPEKNKKYTTKWYVYSDDHGTQYIHPPGIYTGGSYSYVYELKDVADYDAYLQMNQIEDLDTTEEEY